MAKLTEKQKLFVDEYLIDLNATRAYKAVYPNVKKDSSAAVCAAKLLRNAKVKDYIDEQLEKVSSEKIADVQEVMEYLTKVMRREMKESVVVTVTKEHSEYVDTGDGKPRKKTVKEEVPQIVEIPAKLSDANKAAELLGKRYALFTDKAEVNVITPIFEGEGELDE
jgi:phage terminase small subunit